LTRSSCQECLGLRNGMGEPSPLCSGRCPASLKFPCRQGNFPKNSSPDAKSPGPIADNARSIRDLEETRWRFAGDAGRGFLHAKKHVDRGLAGELERVTDQGLHRRQVTTGACGIPGGEGYFLHGHDTSLTFIMERSIGFDFAARMARYLGSQPSAR
jgi:hypothetical protein